MRSCRKSVACLCALTTLLLSCSGTMVIKPEGEQKDLLSSRKIEYVITKASTVYAFESAPAVVNDSIFGEAKSRLKGVMVMRHVSIPVSEVEQASVKDIGRSWVPLAVILGGALLIRCIVFVASGGSGSGPNPSTSR